MRVAMIGQRTNLGSVGGIEGHVGMLAQHLADRGHEVTVFTRRRYGAPAVPVAGVTLARRPCLHTKHFEAISHSLVTSLECAVRGFDLVHYHGVGPALTIPIGRLSRSARVCVTIHDQDYNKDKWSPAAQRVLRAGEAIACRYADELIVVARYLQRHLAETNGRTAHYVPNGRSPVDVLPPGDHLRRFGLEPSRYLLFLARLVPEKGCHTLIDAVRASSIRHRLAIVGGSSHSADYAESLRVRAGDDPRIVFLGHQTGDALAEVRSNAACYVMPSFQEGLPLSLLEALYSGLSVIASDIPASHEVITERTRERVELFPPRDVGALRRAIERVPYPGPAPSRDAIDWPTWADVAAQVEAVYLRARRGTGSGAGRHVASRRAGRGIAHPPTG